MSIYKIKTKQNKTRVNRKIQKINSKQEKKTFLQRQVLEADRTLDASGWKQRERHGFRRFLTRKKSISLELLIIGSVSLSPVEILGNGYQGLVEREDGVMEVLVCFGGAERNGERERER